VCDESIRCFDILPLLVATDGAISAFGYDGRRLRPNVIIGGVEGLAEREWPGMMLRIGEVQIGVRDLRGRCIMTTYDPDTLEQDRAVLQAIRRDFDGKLALNCFVVWPGEIRVGDSVELQESR
jgi:MOSC domain-containing protein